MSATKKEEKKSERDAALLEEAGMTIVRHDELEFPDRLECVLHKINHDWARLLSRNFLSFANIIHQKDAAKRISKEDQERNSKERTRLVIPSQDFPTDEHSERKFVQEWPQSGKAAAKRQHKRAEELKDKMERCNTKLEPEWQTAFKTFLEGVVEKADPLGARLPSLPWLCNLDGIEVETNRHWIHGQRELELNRQRNPRPGCKKLHFPKPDNQISFAIRSQTKEAEDRSREPSMQDNHIFHDLEDDPIVNNFSYSTLTDIAEYIDRPNPSSFTFFPAWSVKSLKQDQKRDPSNKSSTIGCFPWLICEHKHFEVPAEDVKYSIFQAANGCAVALAIFARLARRGHPKLIINDVRPVFAVSSKGQEAKIWVAYISGTDGEFLKFEMHEIWRGSLYSYINVFKFSVFLDRLHNWAVKSLKPWISSCLDHWQHLRRLNPQRGKSLDDAPSEDGLGRACSDRGTATSNQNQTGEEECESSEINSVYAKSKPSIQPTVEEEATIAETADIASSQESLEAGGNSQQIQSRPNAIQVTDTASTANLADRTQTRDSEASQSWRTQTFDSSLWKLRLSAVASQPRPLASIFESLNLQPQNNQFSFTFGSEASQSVVKESNSARHSENSQTISEETSIISEDITSSSYGNPASPRPGQSSAESDHISKVRQTEDESRSNASRAQVSRERRETSQQAHESPTPSDAMYLYNEPTFQNLLMRGTDLLWSIEQELDVEEPTSSTQKYIDMTKKTFPLKSCKPHSIAVLGGGGVGKSSLINALLGLGMLAPSGASGSAVTRFATEYYHEPDIKDEFQIKVEYQTDKEVKATISGLVANFRNLSDGANDNNQVGEGKDDQQSDEEDDGQGSGGNVFEIANEEGETDRRREAAESALKILFEDQPDWQRICGREGKIAYQVAVDQLILRIERSETGINRKSSWRLKTVGKCHEELEKLSNSNLWPLIKMVRVYSRSAKIDKGIVLLDLPGLRDTNDARIKVTEMQIARASHIFLVTGKARILDCSNFRADINSIMTLRRRIEADDESSLSSSKEKKGTKKNKIKVTIVCTKTDELKYAEERTLLRKDFATAKKLDSLEAGIETAKQVADLEKAKNLEVRHKEEYMEASNGIIRRSIQKKYARALDVKVFCVSSEEHKICRRDSHCTLCEIPQLRRHCSELIAQDRLRISQDFVRLMLPGLIAMMRSWYDGHRRDKTLPSDHGCIDLKELMSKAQQLLKSAFDDFVSSLEAPWNRLTKESLQKSWKQWDRSALETVEAWGGLNYQSHLACCRGGGMVFRGRYRGNNFTYHWNKELLDPVTKDTSRLLMDAEQESSETLQQFVTEVQACLAEMKKSIRSSSSKMAAAETTNLLKAVSKSTRQTQRDIDKLESELGRELSLLHEHIFKDESPSSILRTIMQPIYQSAVDIIGGKNSRERRQQCIIKPVAKGIFKAFAEDVEEAIWCVIDDSIESAQKIMRQVHDDLNALIMGLEMTGEKHLNHSDMQLFRILDRYLKDWEAEAQQLSIDYGEMEVR